MTPQDICRAIRQRVERHNRQARVPMVGHRRPLELRDVIPPAALGRPGNPWQNYCDWLGEQAPETRDRLASILRDGISIPVC